MTILALILLMALAICSIPDARAYLSKVYNKFRSSSSEHDEHEDI